MAYGMVVVMKGAVRRWMWMTKRGYSRNGRDVSGNKTNEKLTKTVKGKRIASINKRWGGANTTVSNQRRNTSIDMDHPASTNICIPWHQVITAAIILPDPTIIIITTTFYIAVTDRGLLLLDQPVMGRPLRHLARVAPCSVLSHENTMSGGHFQAQANFRLKSFNYRQTSRTYLED